MYVQYEQYKDEYHKAMKRYEEVLNEKEQLFQRTQPGIGYEEHTGGGGYVNKLDQYVIDLERKQINERLEIAESIMIDWRKLCEAKELELRQCKDHETVVYVMRFIDHKRIRDIENATHYSRASIYRYIERIATTIQHSKT